MEQGERARSFPLAPGSLDAGIQGEQSSHQWLDVCSSRRHVDSVHFSCKTLSSNCRAQKGTFGGAEIADQASLVRQGAGTPSRIRHGLAWGIAGVIAQVAFTAGWAITEIWQGPKYSLITDTISDTQASTAPHVWFPIACFALAGVGTFAFAVFGLRPALSAAGKVAWFAPWLLAFSALALGNSFPLIPCQLSNPGCTASNQLNSPGGTTDAVVSGLAFFILVVTPFPLWRRLRLLPGWRRVKPILIGARIVGPLLFVLLAVSSSQPSMPALGLIERLLATTSVVWIVALAVNLILESRVTEGDRPPSRATPQSRSE